MLDDAVEHRYSPSLLEARLEHWQEIETDTKNLLNQAKTTVNDCHLVLITFAVKCTVQCSTSRP